MHSKIIIKLIGVLLMFAFFKSTINAQQCLSPDQCAFVDCCCRMYNFEKLTVSITCSDFNETFPVRNTNPTYITQIARMSIYGSKFLELPSRIFDGLNVEFIEMHYSEIGTIKKDSFIGLTGLILLQLYNINISIIEPDAFLPIQNITRSTLWGQQTVDSILLKSGIQFPQLIDLSLNTITELNANWFTNLPKLNTLYFSPNSGVSFFPSKGFFTTNPQLEYIYLSYNRIKDALEVLKWLGNVKKQLLILDLSSNEIEEMPDEISEFSQLIQLDIKRNKIRQIESTTFQGLAELTRINLRDNGMSSPADAFKNNSKLEFVNCENNKFKHIHDFSSQKMSNLYYGNQNGFLVELKDYQFDFGSPFNDFRLDLVGNSFNEFGNHTFCSREDTGKVGLISSLSIGYESLMRMDKCLLRQLGFRNQMRESVSLRVGNKPNDDPGQLCTCEYKQFLAQFEIYFSMNNCDLNCWPLTSEVQVKIEEMSKECEARKEFECVFKNQAVSKRFDLITFIFTFGFSCLLYLRYF